MYSQMSLVLIFRYLMDNTLSSKLTPIRGKRVIHSVILHVSFGFCHLHTGKLVLFKTEVEKSASQDVFGQTLNAKI